MGETAVVETRVVAGCAVTLAGAGRQVVCVPAFADSAVSWRALLPALAVRGCEVAVIDLPGFGASPPPARPAGLAECAQRVVRVVDRLGWAPVTVLGHSLGSVIAVGAARQLGERCAGLVSLEGNLTAQDAYFSGQATGYDEAEVFQRDFTAQVNELVGAGRAPVTYADSVRAADARCMWTLGRDAAARGAHDEFGQDFRDLTVPTIYLWATDSTPAATRDYLLRHELRHHELAVAHHWPWTVDPEPVADAVAALATGH